MDKSRIVDTPMFFTIKIINKTSENIQMTSFALFMRLSVIFLHFLNFIVLIIMFIIKTLFPKNKCGGEILVNWGLGMGLVNYYYICGSYVVLVYTNV